MFHVNQINFFLMKTTSELQSEIYKSNQISHWLSLCLLWRRTLPHIVETRGSWFSSNGIQNIFQWDPRYSGRRPSQGCMNISTWHGTSMDVDVDIDSKRSTDRDKSQQTIMDETYPKSKTRWYGIFDRILPLPSIIVLWHSHLESKWFFPESWRHEHITKRVYKVCDCTFRR